MCKKFENKCRQLKQTFSQVPISGSNLGDLEGSRDTSVEKLQNSKSLAR